MTLYPERTSFGHLGEGPVPEGMNPRKGDVITLSDGRSMTVLEVSEDGRSMEVWITPSEPYATNGAD